MPEEGTKLIWTGKVELVKLLPEEIAHITDNPQRCAGCNHLAIFHIPEVHGLDYCDLNSCTCPDYKV